MIWGLAIPNKVRNFIWRSCRDAIPTKKNLRWRQILIEDICDHCKQSSECVLHAFWCCSDLSAIWDSIPAFLFCQTQTFLLPLQSLDLNFNKVLTRKRRMKILLDYFKLRNKEIRLLPWELTTTFFSYTLSHHTSIPFYRVKLQEL